MVEQTGVVVFLICKLTATLLEKNDPLEAEKAATCHFQKVLWDRTPPDPPGTLTLAVCFSSTFACELHIHSSFAAHHPPSPHAPFGETRSGGLRLALRRRESKHPECPRSAGGWGGGGRQTVGTEEGAEKCWRARLNLRLLATRRGFYCTYMTQPPPPTRRADGWGSSPSQRLQMAFNSEKFICSRATELTLCCL